MYVNWTIKIHSSHVGISVYINFAGTLFNDFINQLIIPYITMIMATSHYLSATADVI